MWEQMGTLLVAMLLTAMLMWSQRLSQLLSSSQLAE
jgi:hypothetical protein